MPSSDTLAAIAAVVVAVGIGIAAWVFSGTRRNNNADPDEPTVVATFHTESEAAEWQMRLQQLGIRAMYIGNSFSRAYSGRGAMLGMGVKLQTRAADAPRAVSILQEEGCKGLV